MVKHARAARLRYSESNETKNKEEALSAKNLKRKVIDEEIHDVRKKRKCIQDNIVYMNNKADKFSIVAEEKSDFTLLKRANDLRKLSNDKISEIKKLEKMEEDLMICMNAII